MQFKDVQSFIRGIFEKDGVGARIADGFLTKLHNFDIDITGKVKQRRGYTYWYDLIEDHSVASALGIPDVINKTGFEKKIQTLYFYTDVAGIKHIVVIVDGKIFEEKLSAGQRIWVCLNPSGDMDISEKTKYIDVKSYLDILFFNNYQKNVYMYNTRQYSQAGYVIAGNRLIYFAGDKIYFRDYNNFDTEYHKHAITAVSRPGPPDDEFHIAGNYVHNFTVDDVIKVKLTGEVDYTDFMVTAIFYDIPNDETDIKVGVIPGAATTGDLKSQYRILIEDNAVNFMGKAIYDSLVDILFLGGGKPAPTPADLNFGYCIRIGNETTGYYYYALSNAKNQVAADKCWLVKFDDRFIAQDFIDFPMDIAGDVINFAYWEDYFYVWCKKGKIYKVDTDFTSVDITGDAAFLEGPPNSAGKKQYSIAVNDNGIFVYTDTLPDKDDWYQPIISEKELNLDSVLGASSPTQPTFPGSRTVNLQGSPEVLASKEVFSSLYDKWDSEFWWGDVDKMKKDAGFTLRSTEKGESLPANSIYMRAFHLDIKSSDLSDVVINADNTTRRYDMSYYITPVISDSITFYSPIFTPYRFYHTPNPASDWVYIYENPTDYFTYPGTFRVWNTVFNDGNYNSSNFVASDPYWKIISPDDGFVDEYPSGMSGNLQFYEANGLVLRSNIIDWTTQKVKYSTVFQYDKSLAALSDEILYTTSGGPPADTLDRRDDTFYLIESTFNSKIFTSKTEPDYVLLVWLNFDGSMKSNSFDTLDEKTKTIRYFFPLGKHSADLRNVVPLTIEDNELYFGTSMVDDPADEENGIYMKMNVSDFSYVTKKCQKSSQRYRIPGDSRWFLRGDADANFYRGAGTWEWDDGFDVYENYINLDTFGSNLVFHIYKVTGAMNGAANENLIQYLGTPKTPFLIMDNDNTSELIRETQLRYYIAFKMYSEKTTHLSAPTEAIEIPQLNSSQAFTTNYAVSNFNIDCTAHEYAANDVVRVIEGAGTLPSGLAEDTDYYVLYIGVDDFELAATPGGTHINLGSDATPPVSVLKMNQDVKIILSGLNLENIDGINIYKKEDVEEIQVYRAQLNYGKSVWGDPIIVKSIDKDVDGNFDYSPFANETWEDNTQSYIYSPFTAANVFKYPVSDMEVHKNRLVLINRIDYENPNVIQYSDVDMADALPPDNLRPIESGDGDKLTAGISAGDYLFLFKEKHIYAILGDVYDGQLIDIDKKIGCPYKNMIIEYNNAVFFLNDHGVFILSEGRAQDLVSDRIKNYFDRDRDDSIDFETLGDNGFTSVDEDKKEIKFYVPQKLKGQTQTENNLVIIYNFKHNYFKTYSYKHNITQEADIKDLETNEFKKLISDYSGNIYEISKDKNDADNKILYIFRTKEFNLGTDLLKKNMKILKVHGKYLNNMVVTYWIDGQRQIGKIIYRKSYTGRGEAIVKIWNGGKANCIMIEISGEGLNDPPIEIDEILIGYVKAGGFR